MKYLHFLISSLVFLSIYIWIQWPSRYLNIIFCDVGQGDAILITYNSTQILIDGGKDEKVLDCLEKKLPFWDKKIEVVVATHPDADHIGGLPAVFEHYSVDLITTNGASKESTDFEEFKKGVSRKISEKTKHLKLKKGDQLALTSQITFTVLAPLVSSSHFAVNIDDLSETQLWDEQSSYLSSDLSSNDGSIVLLLRHEDLSVLLTGDLEEQGELSLVMDGLLTRVDVLKVGHHGSKTSTSPTFLAKVRPEISVISSGIDNSYGHPAPEVMTLLHQSSSAVYRTDTQGTLHFVSDGRKIWLF